MSSHYTKQAFILFIISLLFAGFIWLFNANTSENVLGNRVFENADNNISSIIFESERLSVTLDKSDNMWRIRQADSYFANHALANALVKFINYAKIYRRVEMTEEEIKKYFSDNITIKIADMNNQPLGKIILSSRKDTPKTAYAQIEGKEGIFKIEEDIVFPTQFMFWLQQPLLNLYPAAIKSLRIDDETVTRQRGSKYFYREDKSPYSLSGIEKTLNNLEFETVISAQNFDEAFLNIYPNFIVEFNQLLKTEERISLPQGKKLPPELRIFALIRLGITDTEKIAKFLQYSINTVYSYRTKIKNKAINKADFDTKIAMIG